MLLKERVKLLKLENQDLAERIIELENQISDVSQKVDYFTVKSKSYVDTALGVEVKKLEDIIKNVIDAINNQHRSLREEKAELETKYETAVLTLRQILSYTRSGPTMIDGLQVALKIIKTFNELNEPVIV